MSLGVGTRHLLLTAAVVLTMEREPTVMPARDPMPVNMQNRKQIRALKTGHRKVKRATKKRRNQLRARKVRHG